MKRLLIFFILLAPGLLMAQESGLNDFFDKYSGKEGYSSIYITRHMFELFAKADKQSQDQELDRITSNLDGIKILTKKPNQGGMSDQAFLNELNKLLPRNTYKELMVIRDGGQKITFLIREKGDRIAELVMQMHGDDETGIIFMEGDMTLQQISQLSESMEIKGFEHLEKVDEKENE